MCKTYDAIYELSKHVDSNILICSINHAKIEGELHKCGEVKEEPEKFGKCYDGVITLKNAKVTCKQTNEIHEFSWLNISSKHIQMFAFKCCEK